MKKYSFKLFFSHYNGIVYAKNKKEAKDKIQKIYIEYKIDEVLQYLLIH